jgi:hypothetical protein
MAIDPQLYAALRELEDVLKAEQLPSSQLPGPEAISRLFALWFSIQAFLFMQQMDDEPEPRRVSGRVAQSMRGVGNALRRLLPMEIPSPREGARLSVVSSWFSLGGAAVGGDNWCRHADGKAVPMEVYRNHPAHAVSELEMTCSHGHTTQYDTQGGGVLFKK